MGLFLFTISILITVDPEHLIDTGVYECVFVPHDATISTTFMERDVPEAKRVFGVSINFIRDYLNENYGLFYLSIRQLLVFLALCTICILIVIFTGLADYAR